LNGRKKYDIILFESADFYRRKKNEPF